MDLGVAFQTPRGVRPRLQGSKGLRSPLESHRVFLGPNCVVIQTNTVSKQKVSTLVTDIMKQDTMMQLTTKVTQKAIQVFTQAKTKNGHMTKKLPTHLVSV